MWGLTDPRQATRVVMDTPDFYVRQLLAHAVAVGERVAIYSDHPEQWLSLAQPNIAVVQRRGTPYFVPTIVVNDRPTAPPVGLSATVITLGRSESRGPAPDLRFVQYVVFDGAGEFAEPDAASGDRGVSAGLGLDGGGLRAAPLGKRRHFGG